METEIQGAFDAFDTLGLERRLDVSDDVIESAWQRLSREIHPDSDGGDPERAAAVNRARGLLSTPGSRLRHWLELHGVSSPRQSVIDGELMNLFSDVGETLSQADEALKRRSDTSSALGRALLAGASFEAQQRLQAMLGRLLRERVNVTETYPEIEQNASSGDFSEAIRAAARLGFLEKWEIQCRSRLLTFLAET